MKVKYILTIISLTICLFTTGIVQDENPAYYIKKDTWHQTILALREALMAREQSEGSGVLLDMALEEFTVATWVRTSNAEISHTADRPYILHSCGKLDDIMNDLINDVKIDAKHSFEDNIQTISDAKQLYGDKIAVLGGIDVDFLCRSEESEIRKRVRDTVVVCQPGGGFCLGTGNTVANYIPVENYLTMVDESRLCL